MGTLAVLLAIGRILIANGHWCWEGPGSDAMPALCFTFPSPAFEALENANHPFSWSGPCFVHNSESIITAILSAIFILLAFLGRVIRLYQPLSQAVGRATRWLDDQVNQLLWVLFRALCTDGDTHSLKRSLLYRPVYGLVSAIRLVFVLWASLAMEASNQVADSVTVANQSTLDQLGDGGFYVGDLVFYL